MRLSSYAITEIGLKRKINQDAVLVDAKSGLFAVADGLGGLAHGEVASALALQIISQTLQATECDTPEETIREAFLAAHRSVQNRARILSKAIGTTLTLLRVRDGQLQLGHVGDSGCIHSTPRSCNVLSRIDTMGELARQGRIDPRKYPKYQPHYLTQCIGQERAIDVQTRIVPIEPPLRLFLYSDGCLPKISLSDLHHLLWSESSPQVFLDRIERQIYDEGAKDNYTGVAVFIA